MRIKFPWDRLEPGQGFFVPCLDTAKVIEKGLLAAVPFRVRAQAEVGVRRGQFGVWFSLKPASPRRGTSSSTQFPAA